MAMTGFEAAVILALLGGIPILIGEATGSLGLLGTPIELLAELVPPPLDTALYYVMTALGLLASTVVAKKPG